MPGIDEYTKLMIHGDGWHGSTNIIDSSPSGHTISVQGAASISTAWSVFSGSSIALLNDADRIHIAAHADFDFSGGIMTVDTRLKIDDLSIINIIFNQGSNNDNREGGSVSINGQVNWTRLTGGVSTLSFSSAAGVIVEGEECHLAFIEDGNSYIITKNGIIIASTTSSDRSQLYTGLFYIGYRLYGVDLFSRMYVDEYRVSNGIARWAPPFEVSSDPYSVSAGAGFDVRIEHRDKDGVLKDQLQSIYEDFEFEYARNGGCGYFELEMQRDFFSTRGFTVGDEIWLYVKPDGETTYTRRYRGYVQEPDPEYEGSWIVRGTGLLGQLETQIVTQTYTNMEVEDIVKDILDNYVVGVSGVNVTYDGGDIDTTGLLINEINFDESAKSAISKLADIVGNREWGVDEDGKFFFKARTNDISHTLVAGANVEVYKKGDDFRVINRIEIRGGRLSDGSIYQFQANNSESQNSFGFGIKAKIFNNSSIENDTDANRYAQSIMQDTSNITRRAEVRLKASETYFHESKPIGFLQVPSIEEGLDRPIYGTFLYGTTKYAGIDTYQLSSIRYSIANGGSGFDVRMSVGGARPEMFIPMRRMEFGLEQVRAR